MTEVLLIIALVLYFLPAIVAYRRRHQNESAIIVLNLLLGWTLLGWIAALVWASTQVTRATKPDPRKRCPQCGEEVSVHARICRFCTYTFGTQPNRNRGLTAIR